MAVYCTYIQLYVLPVKEFLVTSNIAIDENLLEVAMALGNHRSKKEAATAALQVYVERLTARSISVASATVNNDQKTPHKRPGKVD